MKTGITKAERTVLQRLAAGLGTRSSDMSGRIRSACEHGWVNAGLVDVYTIDLRRTVYIPRAERLEEFKGVLERT